MYAKIGKIVKIKMAIAVASIFSLFSFLLILSSDNIFISKISVSQKQNALTSQSQPQIVFYNRIPKTGSTTFVNAIAYDLYAQNGFNVAHLNLTKNRFQLGRIDQMQLVQNLSSWTQRHPLFIHGHIAFVNFQSFGISMPAPIWINIIREPFDRFVSHYYFLRYGDNFRVGLKRSKAGNNETFDQCFLRGAKECEPSSIWMQIPYFCGTAQFCNEPGNVEALAQAKRHLIENYMLVGVTERIGQMVYLLEQLLPHFFHGAGQHFRELDEKRIHLRHTIKKISPSEEVEQKFKLHPIYKMEREFYDFALAEFDAIWKKVAIADSDSNYGGFLKGQFHFEKIRP